MSSLALYRTYRPGKFADVVGQEHVTDPLTRALENDRVHHAYLFSGPRGCGKTSSARILARSLNCEKGPTADPCGECQSCVDLAPNGPGNIDVVELDAATHGLVDDARDLREKAHFAPVSSHFKIYIVDEAHQLGPGAANALLKLIEEPPAHLKFIFATTAPDKIIGTIRSRTHHYPFRLIPTKVLQQNLGWICEQEGVPIEPAALALVARAGGGSARDAQSILGQLIAGAGDDGVTYELAVGLLGFTDAALLDQVIEAIAAGDGRSVFAAVDRVMDAGHDPRRFLTDLLERFRDLVVLRAAPDAVADGLLDLPPDQAERMATQASQLGPSDLIRLAAVIDDGITAMKGATPTRLQLELVCARLLLPGADHSVDGVQARLDRIERRLSSGVPATASTPAPETAAATGSAAAAPTVPPTAEQSAAAAKAAARTAANASAAAAASASQNPASVPADAAPLGAAASSPTPPSTASTADDESPSAPGPVAESPPQSGPAAETSAQPGPAAEGPGQSGAADDDMTTPAAQPPSPVVEPAPSSAAEAAPSPVFEAPLSPAIAAPTPSSGGLADVRRMWPEVLVRLKEIKRTPWSLISQESSVADVADGVLTLAFRQPTLRDTFTRREDFQTCLQQAVKDVLLLDLKIQAIVDPSATPTGASGGPSAGSAPSAPPRRSPVAPASPSPAAPPTAENVQPPPQQQPTSSGPGPTASVGGGQPEQRPENEAPVASRVVHDSDADPDDDDLADQGASGRELLERTLGATVIEEIKHD